VQEVRKIDKKIGRPPNENPRIKNLNIRISENEAVLIKQCADELKITSTEVVIRGVMMVKNEIDNRKK
jgi:hypothetical protein